MRLTLEQFTNKPVVTDRNGKTVSLQRLCQLLRERAYLSKGSLQEIAGMTHPRYYDFENGKSSGIGTAILALDAMGYEVVIQRKKL